MSNSYRPRRTRIYNANYDIGENSYKKLLQDLDHKRDPLSRQRREMSLDDTLLRTDRLTPKVSFSSPIDEKDPFFAKLSKPMEYRSAWVDNNDEEDDFLAKIATKRASAMKKIRSPSPDEFDSKVTRALSQARQIKSKYLVEEADDDGLITALPPRKNKFRAILDGDDLQSSTNAASSSLSSSVMSSTKRISRVNKSIVDEESADSLAATRRANSTRARLADLESEMENMSFKQNEREKRSLNLRKLLRDSESVDVTM